MRNLSKIKIVEDALQTMNESCITLNELKERLRNKTSHNDLIIILEILEDKNKIFLGHRGITWIHAEQKHVKNSRTKVRSVFEFLSTSRILCSISRAEAGSLQTQNSLSIKEMLNGGLEV